PAVVERQQGEVHRVAKQGGRGRTRQRESCDDPRQHRHVFQVQPLHSFCLSLPVSEKCPASPSRRGNSSYRRVRRPAPTRPAIPEPRSSNVVGSGPGAVSALPVPEPATPPIKFEKSESKLPVNVELPSAPRITPVWPAKSPIGFWRSPPVMSKMNSQTPGPLADAPQSAISHVSSVPLTSATPSLSRSRSRTIERSSPALPDVVVPSVVMEMSKVPLRIVKFVPAPAVTCSEMPLAVNASVAAT